MGDRKKSRGHHPAVFQLLVPVLTAIVFTTNVAAKRRQDSARQDQNQQQKHEESLTGRSHTSFKVNVRADAHTGEPIWSATIGHGNTGVGMHAEASPGDGRIYLWGNNGFSYREPKDHPMDVAEVDASTGNRVWMRPRTQPANLTAAGFLANDVDFVPSLDGQVRACSAEDSESIWRSARHGSIGSEVCVDRDRLDVGTGVPDLFGGIPEGKGGVAYAIGAEIPSNENGVVAAGAIRGGAGGEACAA